MNRKTLLTFMCLALGLVAIPALQAQVVGTIQGFVTDDSGAVLPGVTVEVINQGTGATRTVISNAEGYYVAKSLPSGTYNAVASLEGMQTTQREDIQLLIGQTLDINFQLGVETVSEAITVTGETPLVEIGRTSAASYISEVEVQSLPIPGRDFTDFALLTPTVQRDTDRGFLVMSGQRGMYTGMKIDGTDSKSAFFGYGRGGEATENNGLVVAQDSVKEFQVTTSGFAPEYGANGGGYLNVVTKSGTNDITGTAFYLFQDEGMASDLERSPLDQFQGRTDPIEPDQFDRTNVGFSIGGPFKQDKTHYFFAIDQSDRESPGTRTIRTPGLYDAILQADATFLPGAASLIEGYTLNPDGSATLSFSRDVSNLILFGKVDHQINDSNTFSFRANVTDFERLSGQKDEESEKLEDTTSFIASLTSVIGSDKVNEARLQTSEDNLDRLSQRVGEPVEAQIRFRFGNFDSLGKFDFLPIFVEEKKTQIQDNFSYLFGNHDLKFGIDYQKDDLAQLFAGSRDGRYDFRSMEDFLNNNAAAVRIYFGDVTYPNYDETQEILGLYAQDTFRPNADLTVSYGFRYGATYNPSNLEHREPQARDIPDDTDNFEPRVGFTYALGGAANHILRGGIGIFHGRTPSLLFASQVQENGLFPNYGRIVVGPGDVGFVPLGDPINNENPPRETIPSVGYVDPSFEDAEFLRLNLGYEREFGAGWTGGVDVVYSEGDNLQSNIDLNRTYTFDEFGRPIASPSRPDANTNVSLTRQSIGESEYTAVTLKTGKRFNGKYQIQAHYTWSEDLDTDSNERSATGQTVSIGGADRSLWNPKYDWGPSVRDVPSRLVISGLVMLPWEVKLSGIAEYRSGRPFNPTDSGFDFRACGFTALGFNCVDARPVDSNGNVYGRNAFRNESFKKVDLRLSKLFKVGDRYDIDVFAEVFNLFDDQAFEVGDGFTADRQRDPDPDFADQFGLGSTRVQLPRAYQFGVRFSF